MKKLFIGLFIIAAGVAIFFYLRKKDKPTVASDIKKEWIVGQWKIESVHSGKDAANNFMVGIMGLVDSNSMKYHYEFTKQGNILRSLGDYVSKDTSLYEWNKSNQLVWKQDKMDSTGSILTVATLNKDSLQLQTVDSTIFLFTKTK
ncbi:MAG TPA: hypothetical protein VF487_04760 [Chitinophagaceae bacterium]